MDRKRKRKARVLPGTDNTANSFLGELRDLNNRAWAGEKSMCFFGKT